MEQNRTKSTLVVVVVVVVVLQFEPKTAKVQTDTSTGSGGSAHPQNDSSNGKCNGSCPTNQEATLWHNVELGIFHTSTDIYREHSPPTQVSLSLSLSCHGPNNKSVFLEGRKRERRMCVCVCAWVCLWRFSACRGVVSKTSIVVWEC